MDEADVLILAVPSYWGDVPAQLKAFIDRCTPYANTNPNPAHKTLRPGKKCFGISLIEDAGIVRDILQRLEIETEE